MQSSDVKRVLIIQVKGVEGMLPKKGHTIQKGRIIIIYGFGSKNLLLGQFEIFFNVVEGS